MLEFISTELLVSSGLLGVSGLVIAAAAALMRTPQSDETMNDIDIAVRNAPYHRLHNVVPPANS